MNAVVFQHGDGAVTRVEVHLSERNIYALLAQLEQVKEGSRIMPALSKVVDGDILLTVIPQTDFEAYGGGIEPGSMQADTERRMRGLRSDQATG